MHVLAIGAHPDDVEIGCGGYLSALASAGEDVVIMILADCHNDDIGSRREEARKAGGIIGARATMFMKLPDTNVVPSSSVVQKIRVIIDTLDIDVVLVHYGRDMHQDHRAAYEIALSLYQVVDSILLYESVSSLQFSPTVFFPLSQEMLDTKVAAVAAHESQTVVSAGIILAEWVLHATKMTGMKCRQPMAEGFVPMRLLLGVDKLCQ